VPFVPHGKKSKRKQDALRQREADERVIDSVVAKAQEAIRHAPGLCLPACVLIDRVLAELLPHFRFALHLGALSILSEGGAFPPRLFDPRRSDGSPPDAGVLPRGEGFHAWLESREGDLLDPTIFLTLAAEGYDVDPAEYPMSKGRRLERNGLEFVYEPLPQLELIGVAESEAHLRRAVSFVLTGSPPATHLGPNVLDVAWRAPTATAL
jgi:hypothetical protein